MVHELPENGVAVLGGGPVGCLTALYLLRRGFSVDIFESRADMRIDKTSAMKSINLILTSRGFNALSNVSLGLAADILKLCVPVYGRSLHLADGSVKYQAYGPDPSFCNYSISRGQLNIALLDAAEAAGARIHFNHPVDHIDVGKKIIYMYVKDSSPFRQTPRYKLTPPQHPQASTPGHTYGIAVRSRVAIFACDGANSRARQSLHAFLQSSTGVANGVATVLGHSLNAMDELQYELHKNTLPFADKLAAVGKKAPKVGKKVEEKGDRGEKVGKLTKNALFPSDFNSAFDLSGSYEVTIPLRVSYRELLISKEANLNKETGKEIISTKALTIWPRGLQGFLMALPNQDGSQTVTLYVNDEKVENAVSYRDLKTDEDILNFFKTLYPDALPLFPDLLQQWQAHPRGFLGSVQCFPYHFKSNLLLLGDAAHAITPFFGQGLNLGFETVFNTFQALDKSAKIRIPAIPTRTQHITPYITSVADNKKKYTAYALQSAFSTISAQHKVNCDAIATMAVENFIEMGTKTADILFLRTSQYETVLANQFPFFLSRYAMVTHTLIPYSIIYTLGEIQKSILTQLISMETNNGATPLTEQTLLTPPTIDVKKVQALLEKKYQPILDKYAINQHTLRDVTREIILAASALNQSEQKQIDAKL